jgi:uncharacterized protein YycO
VLYTKNVSNDKWTYIIDNLIKNVGKPYDDLFDMVDGTKMSCVELVISALMYEPDHEKDFEHLKGMCRTNDLLLPQMFRECEDFTAAYMNDHTSRVHT